MQRFQVSLVMVFALACGESTDVGDASLADAGATSRLQRWQRADSSAREYECECALMSGRFASQEDCLAASLAPPLSDERVACIEDWMASYPIAGADYECAIVRRFTVLDECTLEQSCDGLEAEDPSLFRCVGDAALPDCDDVEWEEGAQDAFAACPR